MLQAETECSRPPSFWPFPVKARVSLGSHLPAQASGPVTLQCFQNCWKTKNTLPPLPQTPGRKGVRGWVTSLYSIKQGSRNTRGPPALAPCNGAWAKATGARALCLPSEPRLSKTQSKGRGRRKGGQLPVLSAGGGTENVSWDRLTGSPATQGWQMSEPNTKTQEVWTSLQRVPHTDPRPWRQRGGCRYCDRPMRELLQVLGKPDE